jgi:hypothetical protein
VCESRGGQSTSAQWRPRQAWRHHTSQQCRSLKAAARKLFATAFGGEKPEVLLADPWLPIEARTLLSVTIDGAAEGYVVFYSPDGGIDIEGGTARALCDRRAVEIPCTWCARCWKKWRRFSVARTRYLSGTAFGRDSRGARLPHHRNRSTSAPERRR